MYMNRLRHDDFLALFKSSGQKIVEVEPNIDRRSEELLKTNDLSLDDRFSSKTKEILAISGAWIVTQKGD